MEWGSKGPALFFVDLLRRAYTMMHMKGFTIHIKRTIIAHKIRLGPCGKGKGGTFAFRDKSKYSRKIKFKKEVD